MKWQFAAGCKWVSADSDLKTPFWTAFGYVHDSNIVTLLCRLKIYVIIPQSIISIDRIKRYQKFELISYNVQYHTF